MPDDATFAQWERARGASVAESGDNPLSIRPASLRPGSAIEPRQWLYGAIAIRRYVAAVIAPGGIGKTALGTAIGLAVATGQPIIGDPVHDATNVLFSNLEDPEDEFDRRLAAAMLRHRIDARDVAGRIFVIHGRERRLTIAALDPDGASVCYPDKDALIRAITEEGIGLVIVDPFVNSHEVDENSNPHINAAVRAWAEIADATGCAVILIHHTRKGAIAGDADSGRGANALIGACRAVYSLTAMSAEEAGEHGIPEEERRQYVRLDGAKANLSRATGKTRWYKLDSIALGNGTPDYPKGDHVQALTAWQPPSVWQQLSEEDIGAALRRIAAGPGQGQRWTLSRRHPATRWAGRVLVDDFGLTEAQAATVLAAWESNNLIREVEYHDPIIRKLRSGVEVRNALQPR